MFARCRAPIWRTEDFSRCFQNDYLHILIPALACALSVLFILGQTVRRWLVHRKQSQYALLDTSPDSAPGAPAPDSPDADAASSEATDDSEEIEDSGLSFSKQNVQDARLEVRRPRAARKVLILEIICLLGLLGVYLFALVVQAGGKSSQAALVTGLVVWVYIASLAIVRLTGPLLSSGSRLPELWSHSAALYLVQFAIGAVVFRSACIHPRGAPMQGLIIANFALATVLALIVLSVRRGNRNVYFHQESDIKPSREPLASLASLMTFSWLDGLILQGYRRPLEMPDVWNVLPAEKAFALLDSFRQFRKTTKLTVRLLRFFTADLLYQQVWAFISACVSFVPTLLLKAILEYVEDPSQTPRATAWLYVILLLLAGMTQGIADGQALWRGRKICIKLRAVLVGEIYAKTLRRKAAAAGETDMLEGKKFEDHGKRTLLDRLLGRKKDKATANDKPVGNGSAETKSQADPEKDTQVNTGTIINLMSVDSFKVAEISSYWHFLIPSVPVQLVIAVTLLFRILGWSACAGIVVMIVVLPVNILFSTMFSKCHKRIMAATDGRIHTTNEILTNVRIIKYFAWENRFSKNVHEKREIELAAVAYRYLLWALAALIWYAVPMIITGSSFFVYTMIEKRPLYPSVAFTALSLFQLLRFPLDRLADMVAHVLESKVSIDRVEKFLSEDETGKYEQLNATHHTDSEPYIGFENATLSWSSSTVDKKKHAQPFRLIDINIHFRLNGLNIIAGPTGSGKTSLLMGLLGEMQLVSGQVFLPGGYDRLSLEPGADGLTESVAYCAQQAWLVNDTIKQNIVFASPYDEYRYRMVLEACALQRDLDVFENGDETLVGEKGVVVSGGQKQRISLARALYSNSRYILLDDCLSAVDSHTAQHLFEHCIMGPLMFGRTCLLVTHNTALTVPAAQHVVVMNNGKVAVQGSPEKVIASGKLGKDIQRSRPQSKASTRVHSQIDLKHSSSLATTPLPTDGHNDQNGKMSNGSTKKTESEVKNANARTEEKAQGAVEWSVIKLYLNAMGPWYFWFFILVGFTIDNLSDMATNVWIRQWANAYETESASLLAAESRDSSSAKVWHWALPTRKFYTFAQNASLGFFATEETAQVDNSYYLAVYTLLGLVYLLSALFRMGVLFKGALNAARKIHTLLLEAVLRAKFKFFDTTPLGQITNRFSKDLEAVDQEIAPIAGGVLQCIFSIVSIVILISVITPEFLAAAALLTVIYVAIGLFFIQSSRDLKRLESAQRSPLYQQFGETLSGVVTIRAYGDEKRFLRDNAQRVNTHNRPFIYLWGVNRWLALRVDFAGALVSFFAAVFIVINVGSIDAGAAGLSLTYALGFNENILWLVRLYAENEQNMNHVERIKTFIETEQEAPRRIPEKEPGRGWPTEGAVEFVDYSTRYRPDLDPVLNELNVKIAPAEKVGIVGRTGAGKSSMAMALFRGLEATSGKILIDGVDISKIGLQDLRENLTIVPQDPTLFTGTIRSNLDPFGLFTDEEVYTALRQVHLLNTTDQPETPEQTQAIEALRNTAPDIAVVEAQDVEVTASTADINAPAPLVARRGSVSVTDIAQVDGAAGESLQASTSTDLGPTTTNSRENANIFSNLQSPVSESGSNLSQGQRQLLCLARALLQSPRVLVMDEATASIDYDTDSRIQATLRAIRGRTLLTVAHRLQTIADYDKVLVLERGRVVEFGPPWELLRQDGGMFRGMAERSGDFTVLLELAEKAEAQTKLVDI